LPATACILPPKETPYGLPRQLWIEKHYGRISDLSRSWGETKAKSRNCLNIMWKLVRHGDGPIVVQLVPWKIDRGQSLCIELRRAGITGPERVAEAASRTAVEGARRHCYKLPSRSNLVLSSGDEWCGIDPATEVDYVHFARRLCWLLGTLGYSSANGLSIRLAFSRRVALRFEQLCEAKRPPESDSRTFRSAH